MQATFLKECARDLYSRYGDEVSSLNVVFPSQRARLFFSEELARAIARPVWQPRYLSMDEIMHQCSALEVGEKVRLLSELYSIYVEYHPSETFDKFYFWGEILLSDFDLIDKYMIDADMLFRNLYDLKELEADLSYLSDEMRRVIHTFWHHFEDEVSLSEEKRKFLAIWLSLAPIYHRFKERLRTLGLSYQGMMYRDAVERVERGESQPDFSRRYAFVGFNALSECERRMLCLFDRSDVCDLYWDYDDYYTSDEEQEAGHFMRENLREFKSTRELSHDNFLQINKKLQAISCVSNVVQCKHVNTILREISSSLQFDKQTAIVLTDESLLLPLWHSLPSANGDLRESVNVTMGYPLRQTTAYSLVERLLELQKSRRGSGADATFYHADVVGILAHPYITDALGTKAEKLRAQIIKGRYIRIGREQFLEDDLTEIIFSSTDDYRAVAKYLLDVLNAISQSMEQGAEQSLHQAYLSLLAENISKLSNTLEMCHIDISTSIYTALLRRHLQTIRIPFSGEPLQGLQVMGILETRNLDFKNVIILSMNDDNFPGSLSGSASFIPYNLRAAYGIPTPEHHESVYAYYFYRLLQRAERVDMLYCSHADEKSTGEQSRYIYQLDYESPYPISRTNVGVDVAVTPPVERVVAKSGKVAEGLKRYLCDDSGKSGKALSPSAFSKYITCPMQFYFSAIARLRTQEELSDEVDNPTFGNILHAAMQCLYLPLKGVAQPAEQLRLLLKGKAIEQAVVEAINAHYLGNASADASNYTGSLMLIKNIITKYIRHGIIPYDIAHSDFALMGCEEEIYWPFRLSDGREVLIGGIADRIDSMDDGTLRVVDYKTGRKLLDFNGIKSLFEGDTRANLKNILQTMLYSMVLYHNYHRNVSPTLYFARFIRNEDYSPRIINREQQQEVDYASSAEEFEGYLREKLEELFNPDIPFTRCPEQESERVCKYCDYKTICKR